MKKTILAACIATIGMAGAALADAAHGVWQTEVDDGAYAFVTLGPCGGAVCGTITRTFNSSGEYQSENIGRQIVIDMVPNGDGTYEGSVWRPSNNRVYIGRMAVNGNAITLRGCVAGGLICARQNWTRVQ
ncbi:DUF2147 domain-containing protein [Gymnodinialimonas ceratoperidinii]|uniref:DUF2147 domain-containing protein n=1 Tax=Gymnodinialimonas ceratoperidinii TaxID=2856823 RepID=A0A8F6TYG7_9RHOB|nr:DUF2147 domain-containing protein [Gymnodinialimonas ceratoperidinii]QXT41232.1 DUF2147 domain-containing protein [Gymnodinialimonas ceratoperidinii]